MQLLLKIFVSQYRNRSWIISDRFDFLINNGYVFSIMPEAGKEVCSNLIERWKDLAVDSQESVVRS